MATKKTNYGDRFLKAGEETRSAGRHLKRNSYKGGNYENRKDVSARAKTGSSEHGAAMTAALRQKTKRKAKGK